MESRRENVPLAITKMASMFYRGDPCGKVQNKSCPGIGSFPKEIAGQVRRGTSARPFSHSTSLRNYPRVVYSGSRWCWRQKRNSVELLWPTATGCLKYTLLVRLELTENTTNDSARWWEGRWKRRHSDYRALVYHCRYPWATGFQIATPLEKPPASEIDNSPLHWTRLFFSDERTITRRRSLQPINVRGSAN